MSDVFSLCISIFMSIYAVAGLLWLSMKQFENSVVESVFMWAFWQPFNNSKPNYNHPPCSLTSLPIFLKCPTQCLLIYPRENRAPETHHERSPKALCLSVFEVECSAEFTCCCFVPFVSFSHLPLNTNLVHLEFLYFFFEILEVQNPPIRKTNHRYKLYYITEKLNI